MHGQQPLIEMRRRGLLPGRNVWVDDFDSHMTEHMAKDWQHQTWGETPSLCPHISIDKDDCIEALDFRVLTGLQVHLLAMRGDDRAKRLFAAIRAIGPEMLICCRADVTWFYRKEDGGNGRRIHTR